MSNYKTTAKAAALLREAAATLDAIVRIRGDEASGLATTAANYRTVATELDIVTAVLRPTPGLITWNKDNHKAMKNWHPFASGLPKNF